MTLDVGSVIAEDVLAKPVSGVHLGPGTLRDQLPAEGDTLLVFLRHFGCTFCRETVADLRATAERDPDFPPVLFFFQESAIAGRAFLRRFWPGARAVADPERFFYGAFGVTHGSLLQILGPGVWRAGRRARDKGHGRPESGGDIWMMPGVFLVRGRRVVWTHAYGHAGDHPDFARIPELARTTIA